MSAVCCNANTCSDTLGGITDHNVAQRAVLRVLLEAHPRMLGVEELVSLLDNVPRTREALRVLVDDGLATWAG
jgi:hypothetical protein